MAKSIIVNVYDCPAKGPHQIAFAPDFGTIYVSHKEGPVGVFDMGALRFRESLPIGAAGVASANGSGGEGIMPSPDGSRLVVIDNERNDIRVYDTASGRETDRVPLAMNPLSNPKRSRLAKLLFSPDGATLAVTTYTGGICWIICADDLRKQSIVPVAKGPQGMAFAPDGRSLLVACHDSGLLTRIDVATARVTAAYDGGAGIEVLAWY